MTARDDDRQPFDFATVSDVAALHERIDKLAAQLDDMVEAMERMVDALARQL
jgi:tetrahydromethanopterin S-methyltransferase subunit B